MKTLLNLSAIGVVSFSLCAFGCSSSNSKGGNSSNDAGAADCGSSGSGGKGGGSGGKSGGSGGTSTGSGGSDSDDAPSIKIDSPANNAQVTVSADEPDLPVTFTVEYFTLKAPGTCAGKDMCGHVHLLVDGSACNDTGSPYNAAGEASPIGAGLDYCPHIAGSHKITLELHNDDHSPVKDSNGKTISDSITITASEEGDAG